MARILIAPGILALGGAALVALVLSGLTTTRAVQNPTISLDMVTAGTSYDSATNTMTVGAVDNCLTSATANPNTHTHATHVVVQNVEDLIGWQVRLNYFGDKMRPNTVNFVPFTDTGLAQSVSFNNLPIDQSTFVHRDLVTASSIPAAPPDGTNTPQTASFGASYGGAQDFAVSPDTPAKATPDVSSYSAPSGGVLGAMVVQVVGNESGNQLFMNVDDGTPNGPGSGIAFFNGTGSQDVLLPSSALGDGFHGEGVTCAPGDCTNFECPPPPPPTTAPPPTTPPPPPSRTPTPTPTLTPTPTPTPTPNAAGHDARLVRIGGVPKSVRLSPGQISTDSGSIVVENESAHTDTIGVYVDIVAPASGGCSPSGRVLQLTVTLAAGGKTNIPVPVGYTCADPVAANGLSLTWVAVADHGADDAASCPPGSLQGMACYNALADDDQDPADNRATRNGPRVIAQ
jgi:hypothetical protein